MKNNFYSLLTTLLMCFNLLSALAQNTTPYWSLAGNSNASATTSKLGTTNAIPLRFFTNNLERMRIDAATGNISIGSTSGTSRLVINAPTGTSPFRAQINGGSKLIVHSNGGVSVGSSTTAPANGLYVTGIAGIRGAANTEFALNVNASSTFGGINITDPRNGYILYATKTGYGEGIVVVNENWEVAGACISGSHAGAGPALGGYSEEGRAIRGASYGGAGIEGGSAYGEGVWGSSDANYGGRFESYMTDGLYASTNETSAYAGYFNGNVYASGLYKSSDKNLKKNIQEFEQALNIITKLKPKQYEFRNDEKYALLNLPKGKHYGLIAQELEESLPNLVKETTRSISKIEPTNIKQFTANRKGIVEHTEQSKIKETFSIKAIDYTELIPIMIKGMQELSKQNEEQQKEIEELKALVQTLSKQAGPNLTTLSPAYLEQNTPNPFSNNTIIRYHLPNNVINAKILITDLKGAVIKSIALNNRGSGQVTLNAYTLAAGTYTYSLWISNEQKDSKQLIVTR